MSRARLVLLLVACFLLVPAANGQQDYLMQLGTPPGSPTMPVPMGVANLKNGNVHLEFPLRTFVQRNGLKVTSKLIYDSSNCFYMYGATNCISGWREVYSPFQPGDTPFPPYVETSQNTIQCPQGGPNAGLWYTQRTWSNFTFTEATGTSHLMNVQVDNSWVACSGQADGSSGYAMDGSGYFMDVTLSSPDGPPTWTVRDRSGNLMGAGKDTNGNVLSSSDELGRSYMPAPMPPNGVGSQQFAGATVQWESIPIHSNFGNNYNPDLSLSISTISSITLPDGRSYQFTYDQGTTPGNYGQIIEMTLPTGGQVSFTYANISPTNMDSPDRRLTSLSLGGATWNFAYQITYNPQSPPSSPSATTVTAPADAAGIQNQTLYSFTAACLGPNATTPWSAKYYAGAASGTPLRENDVVLDCTGALVLQETTILENGMSSKVVWNYQSNNINLPGSSNVTSKQEYDFSGSLARETTATYQTSATYTNLQITDRPLTVEVYGAGGAASGPLLAQTNYAYDSTSLSTTSGSGGISVLGATGHDDANYGAANTIRGNLTSVSQMVSPGNFITIKTNYYNILGEIVKTLDGRGNATQYDYSDVWSSGTASCVPSVTFAYPTTVTYPASVTDKTLTTYGACDGTVYSVKDQNDLSNNRAGTVYTYDGLQRVTEVSYPDGGLTTNSYPSPTQSYSTSSRLISGSNYLTTTTILDSLGRTTETQLTPDPDCSSGDKTDYTYDALGRVLTVSNPYCTTTDPTYGLTTYSYDALGRTTRVTHPDGTSAATSYAGTATETTDEGNGTQAVQRISQTDALGRLTSVCEVAPGPFVGTGGAPSSSLIGSSGSPAACGLQISGTGFLTTYQYDALDNLLLVNQSGIAARAFSYDSLSRLLTASNPESGSVAYTYDANGNMLTKTAPAPNQTGGATVTLSYCYDFLNRLTAKAYSLQTCSNGTFPSPAATYFYDAPTGGLSITNPVGRLVKSATSDGLTATVNSYDPMGRIKDQWQCTPQNCGTGYFPISYGYNLMGNTTSSTTGAGVTLAYQYNPVARLQSLTSSLVDANHPAMLISGVTYNALAQPLSASLGNGLEEDFTYNPRAELQSISAGAGTAGGTPGTGTATINGTEQSVAGAPPAAGTGTVTFSGTLQSKQVQTQTATPGTGSVSIGGSEQSTQVCHRWAAGGDCLQWVTVYDHGTVSITVNGVVSSVFYSSGSTSSSIATGLASAINSNASINSLVSASASGSTVTITAKQNGSQTNYSLSGAATSGDTNDFPDGSFYTTQSGSTLTGGADAAYATRYDSGSSTITVNGHSNTVNWSGSGTTASSIASGLSSVINADSSASVTASASGNVVNLTAKTSGASTDYTLSSSWTYDSSDFSSSSFTSSNSGSALTGGRDAGSTVYDSGIVWITVNGFQASASYGQGSTSSSIASAIASALNSGSPVTASASGSLLTLTANTDGAATNYSLSSGSSTSNPGQFSSPSFSVSTSGASLTGGSGTGPLYTVNLGYAPDGNIIAANDSVNLNWNYQYDQFNRLVCANLATNGTCANPTSGTPTYNYVYDRFGNRWQQNGQYSMIATFTGNNTTNNNRIDGRSYDAAGNLLNDGTHNYTYDAENRLTQVDGGATASYVYNANGQRIRKTAAGASVDYLYDLDGRQITELSSSGSWIRGELYAGGQHVATYFGGTTYFNHVDWLGTERVRSNVSGAACETIQSLPFGDGMTTTGSCSDISPMHFTGKERDSESGLDNFGARYNSSDFGRFKSPDSPQADQEPEDPQSWNLYTYVRNNAVNNIDPNGKACVTSDGGKTFHNDDSGGQSCADAAEADKKTNPQAVVTATVGPGFWGDAAYHQFLNQQFEAYMKKNHISQVRAELPLGPGEIGNLTELAEELLLSKNSLKHILKHLPEFQKLDPQITIKEVVQIGEDVIKTGKPIRANTFAKSVLIGGKEVLVKAAVNANNMLRTVFPPY